VAHVELAALAHEPFCAGVVLLHDGRLVPTLNDDHVPSTVERPALRVGGVGGGQAAGESVWDCAYREALEELSVPVHLVPAAETWLVDADGGGDAQRIETGEGIAPLLVTREERSNPDVPFADGLPAGPVLWTVTFLATAEEAPRPGDVAGLLLLPPDRLAELDRSPTVADVAAAGGEVLAEEAPASETRLWLHPHDGVRLAAQHLPAA
jgi:8-oxo-dGTP pyrophosphatase MutT (NUDIX family)